MSDLSLPPLTLVPLDAELQRAHPGGASSASGGGRAEPFAWPTPPLPAYPSPTCQIEPEPCVVESRSGSFISGLLTVFEPQEGVARVQVPGEKAAMPLRFSQMRRLTLQRPLRALLLQPEMAGSLDPAQAPLLTHHPVQPYEVTLVGGTVYQGQTVTHVENEVGLFLFEPKDDQGSVERHFIPRVAIERSQVGARLGDLLAEGDLERSRQIEQGVEAQRRLRAQKLGDILLARQVVTPEQLLVALDKQARMPLVRLGEALVALGFTNETTLQRALHQQEVERAQPLGEVLVQRGLVSPDEVRVALARKMGVPVVDVSTFAVDAEALRLVPGELARRLGVLPLLRRGGRLVVAMADASRDDLLATLKDVAQCAVLPALAGAGDLPAAIERAYAALQPPQPPQTVSDPGPSSDMPAFPVLTAELIDVPRPRAAAAPRSGPAQPSGLAPFDATESRPGRGRASRAGDLAPAAPAAPALAAALAGTRAAAAAGAELRGRARLERADSPVVQAFVSLVSEALAKGASRIHLECLPGEEGLQVRLRRDGQLEALPALPAALRNTLIPRIKALAELDVTDTRRAQQGRLSFGRLAPAHRIDLHIATVPSSGGLEDLVIGLPSKLKPMKLDGLGLSGDDLGRWTTMLSRGSGLILHVAPPRSGRTTTLHAALAHLNRPERKLWSIEERIELSQPGLRQMELRPGADMDFAQALQAVQHADADVIMVADLRDPAAARAAVDAALSGRLVLGALPGRNAADGLMRLLDQGLDRWSLADALLGVHSQRLLRRLCSACRMSRPAKDHEVQECLDAYLHGSTGNAEEAAAEREALLRSWIERFGREGKLRRYQSPGCDRCGQAGHARPVAVHELLPVGREMRRLLRAGAPGWNLHRQAVKDGMKSLRQDGIEKMLAGKIGLEELRQLVGDL